MTRIIALLVLFCFSQLPAVAYSLVVSSGCEGNGWSGTFSSGTISVGFESCPTEGGFVSTITSSDGGVMSQISFENEIITSFMIAGHDILQPLTPEQAEAVRTVLESVEGGLAGILGVQLGEFGFSTTGVFVRSLQAHAQAYEIPGGIVTFAGCLSSTTGCFGCCGLGCSGCSKICTAECRAHDECVRAYGHIPCIFLLAPAAQSWARCEMSCQSQGCGGEDPDACCKGVGIGCR